MKTYVNKQLARAPVIWADRQMSAGQTLRSLRFPLPALIPTLVPLPFRTQRNVRWRTRVDGWPLCSVISTSVCESRASVIGPRSAVESSLKLCWEADYWGEPAASNQQGHDRWCRPAPFYSFLAHLKSAEECGHAL